MHGRILLDTNAIIYALNRGVRLLPAEYTLSIITEIELFSYPKLTERESDRLHSLLHFFEIISLSDPIKTETIRIRKTYGIKIPDSIIAATALVHGMPLITHDRQLSRIEDLYTMTLDEQIVM